MRNNNLSFGFKILIINIFRFEIRMDGSGKIKAWIQVCELQTAVQ